MFQLVFGAVERGENFLGKKKGTQARHDSFRLCSLYDVLRAPPRHIENDSAFCVMSAGKYCRDFNERLCEQCCTEYIMHNICLACDISGRCWNERAANGGRLAGWLDVALVGFDGRYMFYGPSNL